MIRHGRIISALRKLWLWSPERGEAIKLARLRRGVYSCQRCHREFPRKEMQVDHIKEIGKFVSWDIFMEKLFCPATNLQALCRSCHLLKTKEAR